MSFSAKISFPQKDRKNGMQILCYCFIFQCIISYWIIVGISHIKFTPERCNNFQSNHRYSAFSRNSLIMQNE